MIGYCSRSTKRLQNLEAKLTWRAGNLVDIAVLHRFAEALTVIVG
jgi:hypothetical protein